MHLLLGHPDDLCCAGVFARLQARGLKVRVVSEPLAPPARLTWRLEAGAVTSSLYPDVPDTEIAGILVRDIAPLDPQDWDPTDYAYMQAEFHAVILAWLASLACPVINRADAARWYGVGTPLFAWRTLLHRSGLRLPEVVITSDPGAARAFRRRLAGDGVAGAVYVPLTGAAGYLLADDEAWKGLAALQMRTPICLTEPHGPVTLACVVGDEVIWDGPLPREAADFELALLRFAVAARLTFVEIALAPVRCGLAVVQLEPHPRLEHFSESARGQILDAVVALLTSAVAVVDDRVPA
jgi:hypothetical protein